MLQKRDKFIFIGILALLVFLTLNRHSKHGPFTYHSEIFSDKAGYHVYLPALFYYNFEGRQFPEDIAKKTGTGFQIDTNSNKVISKYPIGVAVLQLPFFTTGVVYDRLTNNTEAKGYSATQHRMIDLSSAFYAFLGLLFLFKLYQKSHTRKSVYLLLFLTVFGSNLYFYITRDAGLSHAYSFFVFAAFFYYLDKFFTKKPTAQNIVLALFFASLGCLIRPNNILFIGLASLYYVIPYFSEIKKHSSTVFKGVMIGLPIALLLPLLQLVYYKYAFGDFFAYSYTDERFLYLTNPKLARVWFAPANGLLLYSPIYLLALWGCIKLFKTQTIKTAILLILFFSISYVYASWWSPGLGCGYGHRGFIEHLPFFSLPILVSFTSFKSQLSKFIAGSIGLIYIIILVYMQYHYDGCWHGNGYWDWQEFKLIFDIN